MLSRCKSRDPGPGSEHVAAADERERRKIVARKWARNGRGRLANEASDAERAEFERLLAKWQGPVPAGEEEHP